MTQQTRQTTFAAALLMVGLGFAVASGMNIVATQQKLAAYAATGETASPDVWDVAKIAATVLASMGFSVGSLIAFARQSAGALLKLPGLPGLPGLSGLSSKLGKPAVENTIDIAQLLAIQAALSIIHDPATVANLTAAGRSACDSLRDRVFPTENLPILVGSPPASHEWATVPAGKPEVTR